jgi:hypothetical protein
MCEKVLDRKHLSTLSSMNNYIVVLYRQGKFEEAEPRDAPTDARAREEGTGTVKEALRLGDIPSFSGLLALRSNPTTADWEPITFVLLRMELRLG